MKNFRIASALLVFLLLLSFAGCNFTLNSETLAAPSNLRVADELLIWDTVENAVSYTVEIDAAEYNVKDNFFYLVTLTNSESYVLRVRANGDGLKYKNSNYSGTLNYRPEQAEGFEQPSFAKLGKSFATGGISADVYVQQLLYAQYEPSLLDAEFKSDEKIYTSLNIASVIEEHIDELSEDVLRYYYDKLTLAGIAFGTEEESAEPALLNVSPYAESDKIIRKLDKAVLSPNENFVIWYTTEGVDKIEKNTAEEIGAGLEETIGFYENYFNTAYQFKSDNISKGSNYKAMQKTLANCGIDKKHLDGAMQVFVTDYGGDSLAAYANPKADLNFGENLLVSAFLLFSSADTRGAVAFPYILIKPSSTVSLPDLEQYWTHELFHHFQTFLGSKAKKDLFIVEATAEWAAALASAFPEITDTALNRRARSVLRYSSNYLNYISNNYSNLAGYYFFVYLNAYSLKVSDGATKIVNAIYESNPLKYLEQQATQAERMEIMRYLALMNLSQDYENRNFIAAGDSNLSHSQGQTWGEYGHIDAVGRAGVEYFQTKYTDKNYKVTYKLSQSASGSDLAMLVIKEKDGVFTIVDTKTFTQSENSFTTTGYSDYDKLHYAVVNLKIQDEFFVIKDLFFPLEYFYIGFDLIENFSVSYNSNLPAGISGQPVGMPGSITVEAGRKISEPAAPNLDGYTFGGWYKEAGCINKWNFSVDIVNKSTVLYAKWTKISGQSISLEQLKAYYRSRGYTISQEFDNGTEAGFQVVKNFIITGNIILYDSGIAAEAAYSLLPVIDSEIGGLAKVKNGNLVVHGHPDVVNDYKAFAG